jgi:hypothetical protein
MLEPSRCPGMGCLFLFYFLVKNVNLLNTESPRQHCELLGHGVRENLFCGANPKKNGVKIGRAGQFVVPESFWPAD